MKSKKATIVVMVIVLNILNYGLKLWMSKFSFDNKKKKKKQRRTSHFEEE